MKYIKNFFTLIGVLVVISIISSFFISRSFIETKIIVPEKSILEIEIGEKPIIEDTKGFWGIGESGIHLLTLINNLKKASEDDRIQAVSFHITGGNISISQIQEIHQAIKILKSKGKMVTSYSNTFGEMQSGMLQYYFASISDVISLQPMGNLNITGLHMEVPFAKKAIEENNLKFQIEKREKYKSMPESVMNETFSKEAKENAQNLLNDLMDQILTEISNNRKIDKTHLKTLIDKAPFLGEEAKKLNLIDSISFYDEIPENLKTIKHKIKYKDYSKALLQESRDVETKSEDTIALIYADGSIITNNSEHHEEGKITNGNMKKAFKEAVRNPNVKVIVFRVNSGGGSGTASLSIWREMVLAKNAGKKVIVSMGSAAASGGYFISAPADMIIANAGTITGSIGVYTGKLITQNLWKKYGVNWESIEVGDHSGMWSSSREYKESEIPLIKKQADDVYDYFKGIVSKGRNLSMKEVQELAQGKVYTGIRAKELGLVDKIGSLFDAINIAKEMIGLKKEDIVQVRVYPNPVSFKERLEDILSGNIIEQKISMFKEKIFGYFVMDKLQAKTYEVK